MRACVRSCYCRATVTVRERTYLDSLDVDILEDDVDVLTGAGGGEEGGEEGREGGDDGLVTEDRLRPAALTSTAAYSDISERVEVPATHRLQDPAETLLTLNKHHSDCEVRGDSATSNIIYFSIEITDENY